MSNIQPPKPGSPLRASWAQQITERVNQMSAIGGAGLLARDGAGGFGFAALPANQRDRRGAARPMPFEVRFDATLNSNAGGWKIYLPTEHLLSCDGTDIDTSDISGATPIQDANGDDTAWCSLAGIGKNDDHVWLVVTIPSEDSSSASASETATPTAEFSAEEEESEDENTRILNICIAEVSYTAPSGQGKPPTVEIKQSVIGALHLGGGKDGDAVTPDDISTEFVPPPEPEEGGGEGEEQAEEGEGEEQAVNEGKLQIKGFDRAQAENYSLPAPTATDSGTAAFLARRVGENGPELVYLYPTAPAISDFTFISYGTATDPHIRYDTETHKFQVRVGRCVNGVITVDNNWTDIFTAIPHSSTVAGGSTSGS